MVEDQGHGSVRIGNKKCVPDVDAVGKGFLRAAKDEGGAIGPLEF
jgi:hypothetical protein